MAEIASVTNVWLFLFFVLGIVGGIIWIIVPLLLVTTALKNIDKIPLETKKK